VPTPSYTGPFLEMGVRPQKLAFNSNVTKVVYRDGVKITGDKTGMTLYVTQ